MEVAPRKLASGDEETEVFSIFAENNNKTALRQAQGPCPLRAKVVEPVETPTNNN